MRGNSFGRRLFLGGAAALPWLASSRVHAGGSTPKRLVIWHTPAGTVETAFRPVAGATESSFTLGSILEPLESFRDKLLVFGPSNPGDIRALDHDWRMPRGVSLKVEGPMHSLAPMLTGTAQQATPEGWASGVSVDQLVAQRLGAATRFRSLELAVHDAYAGATHSSRMSYAGPGLPMPVEQDPRATFDRLFAGVTATADPVADRAQRRRRSLLDFGRGELARARPSLGPDEQRYLDAHLESIRELERRLDAIPGSACTVPTAPMEGLGRGPNYAVRSAEFLHAQVDLAAQALACDLTRVVSLSFGRSDSHLLLPPLGGLASTLSHHELSHTDPRFASPGVIADPMGEGSARLAAFALVNRSYMQELARFMRLLQAMPEGDGTVLDNTLIVVLSEHSEGNFHTQQNLPVFFAGGASGYFRMGRYVQYEDKSHNDLLVSICHAMGLEDVTTFGDPALCSGPLPGLT